MIDFMDADINHILSRVSREARSGIERHETKIACETIIEIIEQEAVRYVNEQVLARTPKRTHSEALSAAPETTK